MIIRDARPSDAVGILRIYNDAVENTTAIWNERLSTLDERRDWLAARQAAGRPVLVAEADGEVMGYASYGEWRAFEGYRHTVEHSVYVRADARRGGLGGALLAALIERARAAEVHVMVAGIDAANAASIALHLRMGFEQTALMPEVGRKFGRWLDLAFLQRRLERQT